MKSQIHIRLVWRWRDRIFFVSNFWGWGLGRGLAPSPVNSIYFNWYIFALSLFLYAILPFSVNFTGTVLLNRSRHLHVSPCFIAAYGRIGRSLVKCGMRKVKCGIEKYGNGCGMVGKMRNAEKLKWGVNLPIIQYLDHAWTSWQRQP